MWFTAIESNPVGLSIGKTISRSSHTHLPEAITNNGFIEIRSEPKPAPPLSKTVATKPYKAQLRWCLPT